MPCPFCQTKSAVSYTYPKNNFNGKKFQYVRCKQCNLVYLDRFPDKSDYVAMYPPSYQNGLVETWIQDNPYKKLPGLRFSYGYQFDLIKQFVGEKASILDYGCGTGHFVSNANHHGFVADGVEFNPDFVHLLQSKILESHFYTIDDVLNGKADRRYDVIRMSNVLEHLTEPKEILQKLSRLLNPNGVFLIEGPIEDNFSIATIFKKTYFKTKLLVKPDLVVSEPPYHIFFSNKRNQRQFFRNCGYQELHFETSEDAWPFPPSLKEAKGIKEKSMAVIAQLSMALTKWSGSNWGNTFIYCGKANK